MLRITRYMIWVWCWDVTIPHYSSQDVQCEPKTLPGLGFKDPNYNGCGTEVCVCVRKRERDREFKPEYIICVRVYACMWICTCLHTCMCAVYEVWSGKYAKIYSTFEVWASGIVTSHWKHNSVSLCLFLHFSPPDCANKLICSFYRFPCTYCGFIIKHSVHVDLRLAEEFPCNPAEGVVNTAWHRIPFLYQCTDIDGVGFLLASICTSTPGQTAYRTQSFVVLLKLRSEKALSPPVMGWIVESARTAGLMTSVLWL